MKTEITVGPESSLQDILDMLPPGATVKLKPGIYRQKLQIRTPGLTLIGAGAEETRLVYDDYARKLHPDGREYNTFRTWTVAVCADGVSMRDLTVENDALSPREKGQEVALSVYGDDFLMEDCLLRSTQDTLFVGPLPQDLIRRYVDLLPPELRADRLLSQRFLRCRIEGSVDFIFGCGRTLFQGCEIRSVFDGRSGGFAAAPPTLWSRRRASSFKTAPSLGKRPFPTAASSWPVPGGTTVWPSLKTAATKRISARRALTPGWTAAGTRPPALWRSRCAPAGSAGRRLRWNRKDSGCTIWSSPRFRCWCSPGWPGYKASWPSESEGSGYNPSPPCRRRC